MREKRAGASAVAAAALFAIVIAAGPACAEPALILNTANEPPNSTERLDGIADRAVREAFRRIGREVTLVRLPSERALLNANDGVDDGNYARVEGLEAEYKNLVRVPEPVTRFEFVAFSRGPRPAGGAWADLAPYHVGMKASQEGCS